MRAPIVLQAPILPIYDGWLSTFWKPAERVIHFSTCRTFGLGGLAGQKLHIRRLVVPGVGRSHELGCSTVEAVRWSHKPMMFSISDTMHIWIHWLLW